MKVNNVLEAIRNNLPEEHKYLVDILEEETPKFSISMRSEIDIFTSYLHPLEIFRSVRPTIPEITILHKGIEYTLQSPVVVSCKCVSS